MKNKVFIAIFFALAAPASLANDVSSDWNFAEALKHPNDPSEGLGAVKSFAISPPEGAKLPGFSELTDYILAAPDQEDAGTCLYMSLTGILEWWTARLNPSMSRALNGAVDLSERFTVNAASRPAHRTGVRNWRTDSIEIFNSLGHAATNRSYPFAKGYFRQSSNGSYVGAVPSEPGALFGTLFNWVNHVSTANLERVPLPRFKREVLFEDPRGDAWNVGVAPPDLAALVRLKLETRKAPVHVIYNHYGYWHAVVVVGFDDEGDSKNCSFVEGFRKYMKERPLELREKAADETLPAPRRQQMLAQARAQENTSRRIEAAWANGGGCSGKGTFYVRDSIYGSDEEPVYDYASSLPAARGHYSKRLVSLEYDWIKYLANHAVQIYVE